MSIAYPSRLSPQDKAPIHSTPLFFYKIPQNSLSFFLFVQNPIAGEFEKSRRNPLMAAATSGIHIHFPLWSTNYGRRRSPFLLSPHFSLGPKTLDLKTLKSSHATTKSHISISRKTGRLGNRNSRSVVVRCEATKGGTVIPIYFSYSHPRISWISLFFVCPVFMATSVNFR